MWKFQSYDLFFGIAFLSISRLLEVLTCEALETPYRNIASFLTKMISSIFVPVLRLLLLFIHPWKIVGIPSLISVLFLT